MNTFAKWLPVLLLLVSFSEAVIYETCPQNPPGLSSHAICLSKTQFLLEFQDPEIDQPMTCPPNTVCTGSSEICSADSLPICGNTVLGSKNLCNECDPTVPATSLVCVNTTAYAFCIGGKLSITMVYPCSSSTPYCKIVGTTSSCTPVKTGLDCPVSSGGGGNNGGGDPTLTPAPAPSTCKEAGFFPNTLDITCRGYYKCQMNTSGGFSIFSYTCSQVGYAFDPVKKSCAIAASFKCSNV